MKAGVFLLYVKSTSPLETGVSRIKNVEHPEGTISSYMQMISVRRFESVSCFIPGAAADGNLEVMKV